MIIRDITITNFLSYTDKTTIEFSDQSTVFLGQNNTGKSKLFDAINWVLYNRIYITEKEQWIITDEEIAKKILNRKYISELVSDRANAKVSLTILDDDDIRHSITREYSYTVLDSPVLIDHQLSFQTFKESGSVRETFTGIDAANIIDEILPERLSRYFLFQGESVSEIMSLHKKTHFTSAIRELARLEIFETATSCAKIVKDRYKRKRDIKLEKDKNIQADVKRLNKLHNDNTNESNRLVKEIEELDREIEGYQKDIPRIEAWLEKNEETKNLIEDKKRIKSQIERLSETIDSFESFEWKAELTEKWSFFLASNQLEEYFALYEMLEKKGEVPAPVSNFELKRILEKEHCTVCNRPLSSNSKEYKAIQDLVGDNNHNIDSLASILSSIFLEVQNFDSFLPAIPNDIEKELTRRGNLERSLLKNKKELEELRVKQKLFLNSDDDSLLMEKIRKKWHDLEKYQRLERNSQSEKSRLEGIKEKTDSDIKKIESELSMISDSIDVEEEQELYDISDKLYENMKYLEEKINKTIFDDIENQSNKYFEEMTKENKSMGGHLVLDRNTQEVYTIDKDGSRIENINQANRISIQLSFIAGILTVAGDQLGVNFPFIADAPISALGGDNKLPAIKSLINAFDQSILILKDDVSSTSDRTIDPVRQYIHNEKYIENAYLLELMSSGSVSSQYTKISNIKG